MIHSQARPTSIAGQTKTFASTADAAADRRSGGVVRDVLDRVAGYARTFDPPRPVEVEHSGRWWTGRQTAWRLCDDSRGWMADVSWREQHNWGWAST
jgi:hypothetical protein